MKGAGLKLIQSARIAVVILVSCVPCGARQRPTQGRSAQGIVIQVQVPERSLIVSCDAIPGYMEAMEMSFAVRDAKQLASIRPGMAVRFTMVEEHNVLYADAIQIGTAADFGAEQMQAGGLTALDAALDSATDPKRAAKIVQPGQAVPDFALTDQNGKTIRLSDLRGKVVLLTFGYSRCPFPQYCYRLSNNLAVVAKRFAARAGRDLALLTIAIDPEHDQGAALAAYADSFHADPAVWHFLSGPLPEVKEVAALFAMNFWPDEGLITHSLHTVVLDRAGKLVANIEGNQFTAQQLGDLVETVFDRPR